MSLEDQHAEPMVPEEGCPSDEMPPELPEDNHGMLASFENSDFIVSGASQLGLSFGQSSAETEAGEVSKCQSSLFDDDHDSMFNVLDLDVEALCESLESEKFPSPNEEQGKQEKRQEEPEIIQNDTHDDSVDKSVDASADQVSDISPTRKVHFKQDLVQVRVFDPNESPCSPKEMTNTSPDETCRAPIKPILKRRRKKESDLSMASRLHITPPEDAPLNTNLANNNLLQRPPKYGRSAISPLCDSSILEQERYLLKSLLDLDCSVQMMKNRSDVLYARVQRAVQRLHKT